MIKLEMRSGACPPELVDISYKFQARPMSRTESFAAVPRFSRRWDDMLGPNKSGFFPYAPATNLLFRLKEERDASLRARQVERLGISHLLS